MRIMILTNSMNGLYNFRRELIEKLLKEGYEIFIGSPIDDKVEYFNSLGCQFFETPINRRGKNPLTDLRLLFKYIRIIKSINPSVVLTYTIKPNVYGGISCSLLGVPYIVNITGLGTAVENNGLLQKITLFLYKLGLRKSSCVFFQNKENMNFFIKKNIVVSNYRLIPGSGVNLEHFKVLDYPDDEKIVFLFISRIMKEKGIDQYLEAARYIKSKYPNTEFHVLGYCEESYIEKLKELERNKVIYYHGMQSDVRKFHKISHCTIHPTYYPEGMSNVLLESAACARPVIATNRSGCKEIVNNGVNGYLVEEKNLQDLIEKIEKFLYLSNEDRKRMGLAGRKKVEQEFDRNIVIKAYLEEIGKITGN